MTIILFFIILAILILAHEFGHFIFAKRAGVRVDEFGIGFPPRLFKWKRGETTYSVNIIPFGGFVKMLGENLNDTAPREEDKGRSLLDKPKRVQAVVLVAGVFFNLVLAWLLISVGFMSGVPTSVSSAPAGAAIRDQSVIILDVQPESPAEEAGLKPGDLIIVPNSIEEIQNLILGNTDTAIEIRYKRGKEIVSAAVVPRDGIIEGRPAIGIAMDDVGIISLPPHKAIYQGFKMTALLTYATTIGIGKFIFAAVTGAADFSQIAGPIGIIGLVGQASQFGFAYLLSFTAFLSINLAIINMIPFPALDGGRLLFLLIESIKRSPINPKVANIANTIGFALLILLMLIITYNDIIRLF